MLRKIEVNKQQFIIQAYKENEFVNLGCNERFCSRINFDRKPQFESNTKSSNDYLQWINGIDVVNLKSILKSIFKIENVNKTQTTESKQLKLSF